METHLWNPGRSINRRAYRFQPGEENGCNCTVQRPCFRSHFVASCNLQKASSGVIFWRPKISMKRAKCKPWHLHFRLLCLNKSLMKTKTNEQLSKQQGSMILVETDIIKGCWVANSSVSTKHEQTVTTHVTTTFDGSHLGRPYHRCPALWDSRASWWASCEHLIPYMTLQWVGHVAWTREQRMFAEGSLLCGCQRFVTRLACCMFLTNSGTTS
jgi:hypothetical protein